MSEGRYYPTKVPEKYPHLYPILREWRGASGRDAASAFLDLWTCLRYFPTTGSSQIEWMLRQLWEFPLHEI